MCMHNEDMNKRIVIQKCSKYLNNINSKDIDIGIYISMIILEMFVVFFQEIKNFNGSFYGIHLIFAKIMNIRNGLFCKLL